MKRDDVKHLIPGITEEQLQQLMELHGAGINTEKQKATAAVTERDNLRTQLAAVQQQLSAFDGVDVNDLKGQITALGQKLEDQKKEFEFSNLVDTAIRDKKGRNVKAIRAMIDLDAIRKSNNQASDLNAALDAVLASDNYLFETKSEGNPTGMYVSGAPAGAPGNTGGADDGVIAAFRAMNPGMNF